ncbi:hypothetical protein FOMPIDRAFT_1114366 [Fomitopsis schrenkii]|uniref:G-patch domain-containing protein n=1 Tax=Fomitopsis schrenkii TaxID=2126942 RepID=S8EIN9_FOMSC|nr:hypothetical protein FOMPIDRAFT_1114366 [Fomitopsis schrenkii]
MSAQTIARWNAIPLVRPESGPEASGITKRPRSEDEDSDDDVSIVSRTSSPSPEPEAMDIDKYDEYVNKPVREAVTVDTKIKSSNKGFLMLASMGWVEGQPLGLSGDGRVDPVPFYVKNDLTGLGKTNQDVRMIETTVAQRRELDSERQTKETEEQRRAREDSVARRAAVQSEISSTLRPFYCELCDKQFKNVAQYDEHTNSYAHHHKARFRDMQLAARASRNQQEEADKRKEKERKREEKELRKLAKAAGVKITKPPVALVTPTPTPGAVPGPGAANEERGGKKSGWATVGALTALSAPTASRSPSSGSSRSSGWATVDSASSGSSQAPEPKPTESRGGWAPVATPPTPSQGSRTTPHQSSGPAPAFRTGGWTSLETSSGEQAPPPPAAPPALSSASQVQPPELAPPVPSPPSVTPSEGWASIPGLDAAIAQPLQRGWRPVSSQASAGRPSNMGGLDGAPTPSAQSATPSRPQPPPAVRQEASRSGWQQFRAGAPGRRR